MDKQQLEKKHLKVIRKEFPASIYSPTILNAAKSCAEISVKFAEEQTSMDFINCQYANKKLVNENRDLEQKYLALGKENLGNALLYAETHHKLLIANKALEEAKGLLQKSFDFKPSQFMSNQADWISYRKNIREFLTTNTKTE